LLGSHRYIVAVWGRGAGVVKSVANGLHYGIKVRYPVMSLLPRLAGIYVVGVAVIFAQGTQRLTLDRALALA
jgi:hypothetical protein